MEKRKLEIKKRNFNSVWYGEQTIDVQTFINPVDQGYIISEYLKDLYRLPRENESNYNPDLRRVSAETMLMINVLDRCTSIDTESITEDEFLSANLFSVFSDIREVIHNWNDFRQLLDKTVEDKQKQIALEYSVGKVLDLGVSKIIEAVSLISNLQITDDQLNKLKDAAKEINNVLSNSSISNTLTEANKDSKTRKKTGRGTTIKQ